MYNGDEKLINYGKYMPYTMQNFWQWAYSNILHNMQRGTFAEFIVRCALEDGNIPTRSETGTGTEPYDLEGPITNTGKAARVEVKSCSLCPSLGYQTPRSCKFQYCPGKNS